MELVGIEPTTVSLQGRLATSAFSPNAQFHRAVLPIPEGWLADAADRYSGMGPALRGEGGIRTRDLSVMSTPGTTELPHLAMSSLWEELYRTDELLSSLAYAP